REKRSHRQNFFTGQILLTVIICVFGTAQVNTEAIANFYTTLSVKSFQSVNGFHSFVSGTFSPYQSHRSGESRDSAFVVRTAGGDAEISWRTYPVPQKITSDSITFIWACGFGNNLGHEWFDLSINDSIRIPFCTVDDGYWSVTAKNGMRLSFTAVSQNTYGANLGYMTLTVNRSLIKSTQPYTITIKGRLIDREIWYRVFPYADLLEHARKKESKTIYSSFSFIHMGDAVYTGYVPKSLSGRKIEFFTNNVLTTECPLRPAGILNYGKITIPRSEQPSNSRVTLIKLGGTIVDSIDWKKISDERVHAFMNEELVCDRYVFRSGEFPKVHWKNEIMVENQLGKFSLIVTFYNKDFQEVTSANSVGRYGAVIECSTASGFTVKRYITLFCSDAEFDDYSQNLPIRLNRLPQYGINAAQWEAYENNSEKYSFGDMKMFPKNSSDAAVFLAGLHELSAERTTAETPRVIDRQWWITLKGKLDGSNSRTIELKQDPKQNNIVSPLVVDSSSSKILTKTEEVEKLREICRSWAAKGGVPHVTLVVHKGKIIFYEAFGNDEAGRPIDKRSQQWMASITKLLSGTLMMKFVDQGLIDLDAPVSRYLPELSGPMNDRLTVRHLFTHLSGLQSAGEWASDWNVSLENQVSQMLPTVEVGTTFSYNRVGYAIAGKIMERLTGRSVPYLFSEQLFEPLGMTSAFADNTYGGLYCSAEDLAKFAQMLLNRGAYNGRRFFSEQSFGAMLPKKLPVGDRRWGIGTSPMDENGLSDAAFGHGAASGSVLRIDPKNDLIIISARSSVGRFHDDFERKLIRQCVSLIQ
ncbi:MAG: serine hydrolase domain-containing protein, partial [Bacteroidota bacterium]